MRHPVIMCCFNNWALTKEAVASVFAQDIPIDLWVVDNGSNDGTWEQLMAMSVPEMHKATILRKDNNESPVKIANDLLKFIFYVKGYEYVLGIPNDVILPPNLYSEFLKWPRGIVTGSQTGDRDFVVPDTVTAVAEHTPMAVALIRRWTHDCLVMKDGYFLDEGMFHYGSDCCLALRMAACGIRGIQLNIPYYHYCSASLRRAPSYIADKMCQQADVDRKYFLEKYGFSVDDPRYAESAANINFKAERVVF